IAGGSDWISRSCWANRERRRNQRRGSLEGRVSARSNPGTFWAEHSLWPPNAMSVARGLSIEYSVILSRRRRIGSARCRFHHVDQVSTAVHRYHHTVARGRLRTQTSSCLDLPLAILCDMVVYFKEGSAAVIATIRKPELRPVLKRRPDP